MLLSKQQQQQQQQGVPDKRPSRQRSRHACGKPGRIAHMALVQAELCTTCPCHLQASQDATLCAVAVRARCRPDGQKKLHDTQRSVKPSYVAHRRQEQGRYVAGALQEQTSCAGWNLVLTGHSLGGGAAALVALSLLSRYPGTPALWSATSSAAGFAWFWAWAAFVLGPCNPSYLGRLSLPGSAALLLCTAAGCP